MKIRSIGDVVDAQLCCGCGVCSYLEPDRYRMGTTWEYGRRPFVIGKPVERESDGFMACPGVRLTRPQVIDANDLIKELYAAWGPVYGVWEGYACDPEIRFYSSSGGATSALALYCLEQQSFGGVLHTSGKEGVPFLTEIVMSRTREELLRRTGSRYASASPAERLGEIEKDAQPSVFIGKPCDVAAARSASMIRPALRTKLGLTIAVFCAGVPSPRGNWELLRQAGVPEQKSLDELRYRGHGWPGKWRASYRDRNGTQKISELTYDQSWGFLQKFRQWRCYICPDHSGEFADIAVGDPWYKEVAEDELGRSLIVARSKVGRETILNAQRLGYLCLERYDPNLLPASQPNLLKTRGNVWARIQVLRTVGAGAPGFRGFMMFPFWLRNLSFHEKLQSVFSTLKRIINKRLRDRIRIDEWRP